MLHWMAVISYYQYSGATWPDLAMCRGSDPAMAGAPLMSESRIPVPSRKWGLAFSPDLFYLKEAVHSFFGLSLERERGGEGSTSSHSPVLTILQGLDVVGRMRTPWWVSNEHSEVEIGKEKEKKKGKQTTFLLPALHAGGCRF